MTNEIEVVTYPASLDINAFLDEPEPDYNWLIPGIMERGERLILTGREGKGKSTLFRQIAVQCARGIHPFTLEPMPPLRVLYIDLENPRSTVRREFRKWTTVRPEVGFLEITMWPEGLDLSEKSEQKMLAAHIKEHMPELLMIGPMYKLAPRLTNEDDSAALAHFIDLLRKALSFTLMIESHQPHESIVDGERYRVERPIGSSLWMRWPEFGFCLEDNGTLRPWRGSRDDTRIWPQKLVRGGEWPWSLDTEKRHCAMCGEELTGSQVKYCSDGCANAGRQRDFRAKKRAGG